LDIRADRGIILGMIRAVPLLLLCAASFGAVYWWTAPGAPEIASLARDEDPPTVGSVTPPPKIEADSDVEASGQAAGAALHFTGDAALATLLRPGPEPAQPRTVRNVTPATITAPPRAALPPERIAPPVQQVAAPTAKAHQERLFKPVVVTAGTIKAGDDTIHLAGIAETPLDESCGSGAAAWPCGIMARTALRNYIRGRAIECTVPAGAAKIPDPAKCAVGGDDIAKWLAESGWAKAHGSDYGDAADAAEKAKLGLYSATRPDVQTAATASRP
jgi:endonuclease YncB( thermonuclease family)